MRIMNLYRLRVRLAPILVFVLVVALAGFSAAKPGGAHPNKGVTVMTQNLYFGSSLDPVLGAGDFGELLYAVDEVWTNAQDTDFPARAEVIADEIVEAQPDLIGLQEAALWRVQSPGDFLTGANTPATHVVYDFVEILLDELEERGVRYEVVVSQDNLDIELPSITGDDIRLTDRDVIIARTHTWHVKKHGRGHWHKAKHRAKILGTDAGHFDVLLEIPALLPILVPRGWVAADVKVRGKQFRFVNTHLEVFPPIVQELQALELLAGPLAVDLPVVCLGDFNSDAYGVGTDSYEILLAGGLVDSWTDLQPLDPGLTWGQEADLLNPVSTFTERLDIVFYDGPFVPTLAYTVGDQSGDMTDSGLWPSDHAGVVAVLAFEKKFK